MTELCENTLRGLLNRALIRLPAGEPSPASDRTRMHQLELPEIERFLLPNRGRSTLPQAWAPRLSSRPDHQDWLE
jgi:hypothetical protein